MFKSKTLGRLTVQIPDQNNRYTLVTETSIPLPEGGLLYSGLLSPVNDNRSAETQLFVSNDLLKYTFTKKISQDKYEVGIGLPFSQKIFELVYSTHSDNPYSFYGTATDLRTGKIYKFTWQETEEPAILGTLLLIIAGIAAVVCSLADIVGLIANWQCKRVKVNYGVQFIWQKKELDITCGVECVEK